MGDAPCCSALLSHLSFLTCPHLLFNHSPPSHLFLKSSNHTCFSLYLSTLVLTCLCGPTTCVGVESSLLSTGLHLMEHDVVYFHSPPLLTLTLPLLKEGVLRRTTSEFDLAPVIGAWSARSCLSPQYSLNMVLATICATTPHSKLSCGALLRYCCPV